MLQLFLKIFPPDDSITSFQQQHIWYLQRTWMFYISGFEPLSSICKSHLLMRKTNKQMRRTSEFNCSVFWHDTPSLCECGEKIHQVELKRKKVIERLDKFLIRPNFPDNFCTEFKSNHGYYVSEAMKILCWLTEILRGALICLVCL